MATLLLIGDPKVDPNGDPNLHLLDSRESAVCGITRPSAIALPHERRFCRSRINSAVPR